MEWNGRRSSSLDGVFIRASERLQRGQAHRNKNRGAEWKRESNQFSVSPRPCESILGYFEDGAKFTRSTRATLPLQPPAHFPLIFIGRPFFLLSLLLPPFFPFLSFSSFFFFQSRQFFKSIPRYLENSGSRVIVTVCKLSDPLEMQRDAGHAGRILFSILYRGIVVVPTF